MTTKPRLILLLLAFALLVTACAPAPGMVATLTMLPGTPTSRPPTLQPSRTPRATNTLAPVNNRLATNTPIPPEKCPTDAFDTTAPEDPSQMAGRHYDLKHLPETFELVSSGPLETSKLGWVHVKWQGRSMFWTQKQICKDEIGREYWEVVDVLALPRLDAKLGEAMTTTCFDGEKPLAQVVAYGIFDSAQPASEQEGGTRGWPLQVQAAWQIQEEFTPLSLNGLSCVVVEK